MLSQSDINPTPHDTNVTEFNHTHTHASFSIPGRPAPLLLQTREASDPQIYVSVQRYGVGLFRIWSCVSCPPSTLCH